MKILVTGAGGQVGQAVARAAPAGHAVTAMTREQLDICDPRAVREVLADTGADWLVNAAAYTAVDLAESQPAAAESINSAAVAVLADAAAGASCRLLHLSTDFVFDGKAGIAYRPDDAVHPLGVYGATKARGEANALAHPSAVVLRTAWVYAAGSRNFVATMLKLMRERAEVRVVDDQIGCPTWAAGIGAAVWAGIERSIDGGVYHWTDLGSASWYDFALAIQEEALQRGLLSAAVPVIPIPSSAYPTAARRPHFSVLDTRATRACLGLDGEHWRVNLRKMLDELRAS